MTFDLTILTFLLVELRLMRLHLFLLFLFGKQIMEVSNFIFNIFLGTPFLILYSIIFYAEVGLWSKS